MVQVHGISILAPAWGATSSCWETTERSTFQSSPPRGGRLADLHFITQFGHDFNPRPRVGGDRRCDGAPVPPQAISILAPAWGATCSAPLAASAPGHFNPRPRVGGDRLKLNQQMFRYQFQSSPPRGGRHGLLRVAPPLPRYFNPRPRVGGDGIVVALVIGRTWISILAPAWGATVISNVSLSIPYEFQSSPPRGGRLEPAGRSTKGEIFQSSPPRGGRHNIFEKGK